MVVNTSAYRAIRSIFVAIYYIEMLDVKQAKQFGQSSLSISKKSPYPSIHFTFSSIVRDKCTWKLEAVMEAHLIILLDYVTCLHSTKVMVEHLSHKKLHHKTSS